MGTPARRAARDGAGVRPVSRFTLEVHTDKTGPEVRQRHTLGAQDCLGWATCPVFVSLLLAWDGRRCSPRREEDDRVTFGTQLFEAMSSFDPLQLLLRGRDNRFEGLCHELWHRMVTSSVSSQERLIDASGPSQTQHPMCRSKH